MSLLNDALRAAEQRQNRPQGVDAYTGQHAGQRSRRWRLPALAGGVLMLAVAGYVLLERDAPAPDQAEQLSPVEAPQVPEPAPAAPLAPERTLAETAVASAEPASNTATKADPHSASEENPRRAVGTASAAPQVAERPEPAKPQPVVEASKAKPEPSPEPVLAKQSELAPQPAVKQLRETPEAVDQRTSQTLERLLRAGDSRVAEQQLVALTARQAAPASREVFARAMLVQQQPDRALRWLGESDVSAYPALRLLRARALLTTGDLAAAVTALRQHVPPVREYIEYRVTLATLLQQAGDADSAAQHWTALISVDDSRPAWWVGLAIALESRGELASAARAYGQAAQLPGLSRSLSDYVRERLETLQAG
ncbi:hypothetical protein [Marinobacter salinisoli]|nr:hypothetical protein [Marinobacter salinisoli]